MPYAEFSDPQTLNLYGFVGGNPASKADMDGHCPDCALEEGVESGMEVGAEQFGKAAATAVAEETGELIVAGASTTLRTEVGAIGVVIFSSTKANNSPSEYKFTHQKKTNQQPAPKPQPKPQTPPAPQAQQPQIDAAHRRGKSKRTRDDHQAGTARDKKARDEAHPSRKHYPPRKRPDGHKGPWPPKPKPQK